MRNIRMGYFADYKPSKWNPYVPIGMHIAQSYELKQLEKTIGLEYYTQDEERGMTIVNDPTLLERIIARLKFVFTPHKKSVVGYRGKRSDLSRVGYRLGNTYDDNSEQWVVDNNYYESRGIFDRPMESDTQAIDEELQDSIADLHVHCFDASSNPKGIPIRQILDQAKKNKVKYISFVSHNTLDEYEELLETVSETDEYDDIRIMVGVEINSGVGVDKLRDFLVYMPLESIEGIRPWIDANTKRDLTLECQQMQLEFFKKIGKQYGLVFDEDLDVKEGEYAGTIFATNLAKHQENYGFDELLAKTEDPEFIKIRQMLKDSEISFNDILTKNFNWFFSELVRPKGSPFNISEILNKLRPRIEDVIDIAHKNNGLVFTAHPFHMDRDDILEYLDLCKDSGIDGVESIYITQIEDYDEDKKLIEDYCRRNGLLYGCGGTDFHSAVGTDYLGIGLLGDEEHLHTLLAKEIPDWARDLTITIKEFKDRFRKTNKETSNSRLPHLQVKIDPVKRHENPINEDREVNQIHDGDDLLL